MLERRAFHIETPRGVRFALTTRSQKALRGGLLYVHPLAEEMNKSRRMAALAAASFAEAGWLVLQIDLGGCGDSAGDFGDYDWQDWIDDVSHAWTWLQQQCSAPLAVWTLRAGSLLVAEWLQRCDARPPLLLWQPVVSGRQHLGQFLRLKTVNQMLTAADARTAAARLRADLDAGHSVEIAGYALSPGMAAGLAAAELKLPQPYPQPICLLELVAEGRAELSPGIAALTNSWLAASVAVSAEVVHGSSFWQTQEIETAPAFIEASLGALERFAS